MANVKAPTSLPIRAYHEASVNFADTAAEATSADASVVLPSSFKPGSPILYGLKVGEAEMDDNALLHQAHFTVSAGIVTVVLKFYNGNAAAGANINPGAKVFWFLQL